MIAVFGSNGFVGSSILKYLIEHNYNAFGVTRETIDLTSYIEVKKFLMNNNIDTIINAAAIMNNDFNDVRNNLDIFLNLHNNSNLFSRVINLSSAAAYDRSKPINNASEDNIQNCSPKDYYGYAENVKCRLSFNHEKFSNIIIFNCFGKGEYVSRLFHKYLIDKNMVINNNRYFDYFSIQDLCVVVNKLIWEKDTKFVNAVYNIPKLKINEALELFCKIKKIPCNYTIASESELSYTGCGEKLKKIISSELNGLKYGFENY